MLAISTTQHRSAVRVDEMQPYALHPHPHPICPYTVPVILRSEDPVPDREMTRVLSGSSSPMLKEG